MEHEQVAMLGGKDGEGLKRIGGRAFRQDQGVGGETGAGHGGESIYFVIFRRYSFSSGFPVFSEVKDKENE
jgi:hypothetical protein